MIGKLHPPLVVWRLGVVRSVMRVVVSGVLWELCVKRVRAVSGIREGERQARVDPASAVRTM